MIQNEFLRNLHTFSQSQTEAKHDPDIDGFEEWARGNGYDLELATGIGGANPRRYRSADTSNAFIGWIASKRDKRQREVDDAKRTMAGYID